MSTKFVIVTGGVISSVGKGVAAAIISALLQKCGYSTRIKKFDPYLNKDPGTLNPGQHGEVYVTADGAETDLDMGHYERIGQVNTSALDYTTMGAVMDAIIKKERQGGFEGCTVQVVPHVTDFIKERFYAGVNEDIVVCEIGGTVGDIESLPFLEAARQLSQEAEVAFVHVSCLFQPSWIDEVKTKPVQHSVSKLREYGIHPDILACRHESGVPDNVLEKLSKMCGINRAKVIGFPNAIDGCLYNLVSQYHEAGLLEALCDVLKLKCGAIVTSDLERFRGLRKSDKQIAIVTKYNTTDAHRSLEDALLHGAALLGLCPKLVFINAEDLESGDSDALKQLHSSSGIIVPGGFGTRGIAGKRQVIRYAVENNVPFLGICLGMQLAVLDALESIGVKTNSAEFEENLAKPAVCLVEKWTDENGEVKFGVDTMSGGTLRLGDQECILTPDSIAARAYKASSVSCRHRHRYEINPDYAEKLTEAGVMIVGKSKEGLIEAVERPEHRWFVAVQYHPEFSSKPNAPEPLIACFVREVEHVE